MHARSIVELFLLLSSCYECVCAIKSRDFSLENVSFTYHPRKIENNKNIHIRIFLKIKSTLISMTEHILFLSVIM